MQRNSPTIKSILTPAMRRHMRAIPAQTHFLLLLHPGLGCVDFIAVADGSQSPATPIEPGLQAMNIAFNNKREEITACGQLGALSSSKRLFKLCHEVVTAAQQLAPEVKLTDAYIHAVAVTWLEEESLPLGDVPKSPGQTSDPWRITPAHQAQLRFQDALDWYAIYDCSLESAQFKEPNGRFEGCEGVGNGRSVVLKVPTPANRDRIVNKKNLKLFVAEHLLAYNKDAAARYDRGEDEEPELTFFFLPLKGLGQVRAAIDWVGVESRSTSTDRIHLRLKEEATTLQRSGLESLFTLSLIGSFGIALRLALREARDDDTESCKSLYQAFADLWWASEVRFYRDSNFRSRLVRVEAEKQPPWRSANDEPDRWCLEWHAYEGAYPGFVATAGNHHPELSYIRLNLLALFSEFTREQTNSLQQRLTAANLTRKELDDTCRLLPFDEVVFACHFFRTDADDLTEWVDQLAETVVVALIEQTIQQTRILRSRTQALEGVAHWLNSLVRLAGRSGAARKLESVINDLSDDHPSRGSLARAFDSMQLLILLEAGTGLLRLLGTLDEGDPAEKLSHWFTPSSLAAWNMPATLQTYVNSVTHLVRAIGSAFGHPLITVTCGGNEQSYQEYCSLDPDELLFPPLSKSEKGNEPILALLPAITEPISNALVYIKSKQLLGSDMPLRVVIEDCRAAQTPSIKVEIGSPFFEGDHLPSSHGLVIAGKLCALTDLADLGEGKTRIIDQIQYYFVPIFIHPQILAQRLDQTRDD